MSVKVFAQQNFMGGQSTDKKLGPKASFAFSQAAEFRKSPSQLSVMPRLQREDNSIVKDLILKEVMVNSGVIYAYGNAGYFYKRSTAGVWSTESKLNIGTSGLDYRIDSDAIYLTTDKAVSLYNQVSTAPTMFPDHYGPSYSTYNNTDNTGFNVAAYQTGSPLTTAITTTIIENQTNLRYFQTDIEPLVKVSIFVVAKGTGNWTLTLHDGLNNVLGVKTVTNTNIKPNQFNDFFFTAATNQQVRVYPAPNARTYHVHITSTVADGTIASSSINDMSTADLEVWADRLVVTKNGLHPMIRFQQYEAIGNGNYLSIWEPIDDPPTNDQWLRHRLVFPQEYEVCGLSVQNEFIVIAAEKNTTINTSTPQQGILFFWDGTSNTYNYFVEIPEGSPYGLKTYQNVAYYLAGGAWYGITSATTQPVKLRTMPGSDGSFSGPTTSINASPAIPPVEESFITSGTWTCPPGVLYATVEAWGGGGAGYGTDSILAGGGGGGGAYARRIVAVVPGTNYSVVVGPGGIGSTSSGTNGSNSTFNSTSVVAAGGTGASTGTGAAGGTTGASTGDVTFAGGGGGNGSSSTGGGGGGEAGGSTIAGANGTVGSSSGSLGSRFGLGGSGNGDGGDGGNGGAASNGDGQPGTTPGGGGGSSARLSGAARIGGAGAGGQVNILYGNVPATNTLTDNFSGAGSTPNIDKWTSFGNYSQSNGVLSLTSNTAVSFNGINSKIVYDLTSSSMQVRLIDAGNQALTSLEVYPVLAQLDGNNQLFWYVNQGTIAAYKKVGASNTIITTATYVANTFQYLRIREQSGIVYWDYSSDGVTWMNFASTTSPFSIARVTQVVTIDNFNIETSTTTCLFDDYNIPVSADLSVGYPEMMGVKSGVLLMGYPSITANPGTDYGVYSWGAVDKNYPNSFGYSYVLSTGDQNVTPTNNLQIGMVTAFGDLLHVSWRDDIVSGTPRYGIDVSTNSSSPAPIAIYQTPILDSNYTAKLKSGLFVEAYYDLPVGASIMLSYSINRGDWVDDTNIYTSTNLWDNQTGYARFGITQNNGGRFHELQAQITILCDVSTTSSPEVYMVSIVYDNNDNEQIQ